MTATRDRRSDPEQNAEPAWDERSIFGQSRGLPWWGAVLIAFGLAAIAAAFDMQRQDTLGKVYQGAYLVGCVAAICLVRRRSLFGPLVQPPLVFAVTAVAAIVLLAPDKGGDGGVKSLIFTVAFPLTSNFPTMAVTTGITVAIGVYRLWRERDPEVAAAVGEPSAGRRGKDRTPPTRGRRTDADALGFDTLDTPDDPEPRPTRRRGDTRDPGRLSRGDRRGSSDAPRRGDPGRRDPDTGRRGGRRGDPEAGLGKSDRSGRARPEADPESEGRRGFRGRSGRDPRPDQSTPRDRTRGTRGRARDTDPPPRRRDPASDPRPRRDDRSRRDPGDRGVPSRRRPQDPYR